MAVAKRKLTGNVSNDELTNTSALEDAKKRKNILLNRKKELDAKTKYYVVFFGSDFKVNSAYGYGEYPKVIEVMALVERLKKDIGNKILLNGLDILEADNLREIMAAQIAENKQEKE